MKDTVLKISLAGLLHDIGKFAQGCLTVSQEYLNNNAGLYQPFREGRHTHVHAVYTAAFIEQMADHLPKQLNSGGWGEGDAFINLAAGHHKPETQMQWIVTMADRISSGLDRDTFEHGEKIAFQDVKKTRLLPVLESLGPSRCGCFDSEEKFEYAYPLFPITAQSIFPEKCRGKDRQTAIAEYQGLFDDFCDHLRGLYHRESNIELWTQHLDSLLMTYTSHIPAARVGDVVHDVSLYDHCRTTAAIAAALYQYHAISDTMEEAAIREGNREKFLFVGGDFYGIQEFIFSSHGESRKFRSKLLRGRSFAVSLFTELAVRLICDRLDLPMLAVLLNAAGKFHLLAPNLPETRKRLIECEDKINDWLFAHTYGESSLGITATPATPDEFHAGRFRKLWDRHLQNLERRKYKKVNLERHGGAVTDFLASFNNDIEPGKRLCPLCGKRPSDAKTEADKVFQPERTVSCALCRDHVFLGANLVKDQMVAVCTQGADIKGNDCLLAPIFDEFQIIFRNSPLNELAEKGQLLDLLQTGIEPDGSLSGKATMKLINGHVPCYREEDNYDECLLESTKSEDKLEEMIEQIKEVGIKTFSHIAVKARHKDEDNRCRGIEALGVLKADVDHLGMLFGCGLTERRFTISRLATVSRQLNSFFALYLPHLLLQKFYNTYTVFAGGDDLFLIGPWNKMADLACELREQFARFVCHNPGITFSAGITVHKPNTPVDAMAEAAEETLSAAKHAGRNRVTMFGHSVTWDNFKELLKYREVMRQWLEKKYISDSMFYRFNHLIAMAQQEKHLAEAQSITIDEMSCVKWPALFRYSLARNVNKDKRESAMEEVGQAAAWIETHRGTVSIPLWHVLYEKRA